MSAPKPRTIGTHFIVALLAAFICAAGAFFARAATVAFELAQARASTPIVVRIEQPAEWPAVARAADILERTPGVTIATPMTPDRAAEILRRAGADFEPGQLPAFYMVEARIDGTLRDPRASLRDTLAKAGILASIEAPLPDPGPPVREAAWGGGLLIVMLGLALIWLAARAQAQVASAAAIINADIGAPLSRTLSSYGRAGALFGLRAGLIGSAIALCVAAIAIMSPTTGPKLQDLWALIGRVELLLVFGLPLLLGLAAASGARAGGAAAHRKAERLG